MESFNWPPQVGILIPAYQAGGYLSETLKGILTLVPSQHLLVVDDGSTDTTSQVARSLQVEVKRHLGNRGKGTALATGLKQLASRGYAWVITMDADGQHQPTDLGHFIQTAPTDEVGIVVGTRPISGTSMPWHRRFSNKTTTTMVSVLAKQDVYDAQSGFRMYRTQLWEKDIFPSEGRFEWEPQALILASRAGWKIASVPVTTLYGEHGSHMQLFTDTIRFIRMMGKWAWTR